MSRLTASSVFIKSAYLALISNKFASCGSTALSPTESETTIVIKSLEILSMHVALTHPDVVTPVINSVSTPFPFKIDSKSVLKNALGYCFVIIISVSSIVKSEWVFCECFPSSKLLNAGTFL